MKIWTLVFVLVTQLAWAEKTVELRTSLWPPYQVMLQGELSGVSMKAVTCIFSGLQEPFHVEVMPWGRAISDLNSRHADGLFTSIYSEELSTNAVMSSPFALEKWYIYSQADINTLGEGFPLNTRFAAVRSSSQYQWLRGKGYSNIEEVNEGEQLLRLLSAGRIDAFIADERYYEELIKDAKSSNKVSIPEFNRRFLRYTPLGVYFSNGFLAGRPKFMADFNSHITECAGEPVSLNSAEEAVIHRIFERRIEPLLTNKIVLRALRKQNRLNATMDQATRIKLDQTWRLEKAGFDQPFIDEVLTRPLSLIFQAVQDTSDRLFTEIFLVDRLGLNVAQSVVTTDYDQGDEEAYQEVMTKTPATVFIDAIQFDASAMKFHVQVSAAIQDANGEKIGMLTVGINVEEALRQKSEAQAPYPTH